MSRCSLPSPPGSHGPDLLPRYTLSGAIRVVDQYKCQSGPEYTQKRIPYSYDLVEGHVAKARSGGWDKYGMTDEWLYNAIARYPFAGKDVVVMGAQTPWYESICVARGARSCTTIDFQPINSSHPNITTMTLAEYDRHPRRFDVAISISSFEHDGLGRYVCVPCGSASPPAGPIPHPIRCPTSRGSPTQQVAGRV